MACSHQDAAGYQVKSSSQILTAAGCTDARELDKFCQSVDSRATERLRGATSATAQALHMRQQAYEALQSGQTPQSDGEADAASPPLTCELHNQSADSQHSEREASASGRRSRRALSQVSSLHSALEEAHSHSLRASGSPGREDANENGNDHEEATSVCNDAASNGTRQSDAAVPARNGPSAAIQQQPEAALMASRKLVGHAIFGLEVRR